MHALRATLVVVLATGGASWAQTPPTHPGEPPRYPSPGNPAYPGEPPLPGYPSDTLGRQPTSVTKDFKAEVVSANARARTITVRRSEEIASAGPVDITLPVDSKMAAALKELNPGDQVRLICRTENAGGEVVQAIKRVDTRPPATLPPTR
jgi:hypothetical protein